jgi:glutaredoxin
MEVVSNKNEMIFRTDFDGGVRYSIGLSRKNQDGSYMRGYMNVTFRKGVELENKTQIRIKSAWIDFYKDRENRTVPYIFINEFEEVKKDPFEEYGQSITTKSRIEEQLEITDSDLPF